MLLYNFHLLNLNKILLTLILKTFKVITLFIT